jgi:opacity protein-like surface antigen
MKKWSICLLLGLMLFSLSLDSPPKSAQVEDAYQVIAAVNAFRTGQGLPALQIDNSLMAAAQAQSNYQASIQTVTHVGGDGSSASQRAIAYGFGGGAQVFVSENIAGGMTMTIDTAIFQYWQDDLHLHTMLNPAALFIGAGVATAGNYVYYTVDTGYYAGAAVSSGGQDTSSSGNTAADVPAAPSAPSVDPFIIATQAEDGSITHIVGYGQTLVGIANSYAVTVGDLLILNQMTLDTVIYPEDEIIIQPAYTPTITESPTTPAPTDTPLPTETPTPGTPTARATLAPQNTLTATPTLTPSPIVISAGREPVVIGIVLAAMVILIAVIFSGFIKDRNRDA